MKYLDSPDIQFCHDHARNAIKHNSSNIECCAFSETLFFLNVHKADISINIQYKSLAIKRYLIKSLFQCKIVIYFYICLNDLVLMF